MIVIDYLSIQATSIPCKHVFSSAKETDTQNKTRSVRCSWRPFNYSNFYSRKNTWISLMGGWHQRWPWAYRWHVTTLALSLGTTRRLHWITCWRSLVFTMARLVSCNYACQQDDIVCQWRPLYFCISATLPPLPSPNLQFPESDSWPMADMQLCKSACVLSLVQCSIFNVQHSSHLLTLNVILSACPKCLAY